MSDSLQTTRDRSRFSIFVYLFALVLASLALTLFWFLQGRAQLLPDAVAVGQRLQCVSYSPFDKDQSPLAQPFQLRAERIDADFELLARHFRCVRTYSVEGAEALPVLARKHGLKVLLGAWVGSDAARTRQEIEGAIAQANQHPDVVEAVVVGNEALLRREISGARLAQLIGEVKSRIAQPVTYADVWEFWRKHPEVAPAVDFITIHLLPYWEDEPMPVARALDHVERIRATFVREFAPKEILIGETGWPSEGRHREAAVPSRFDEASFLRGFIARAEAGGWRYNLIEAFDQPWKRNSEGMVGGYWGLFDADRGDKGILTGAVSNLPAWRVWLVVSLAIAVAVLLLSGVPRATSAALVLPLLAGLGGGCIAYWLQVTTLAARDHWEWLWALALVALNLVVLLQVGMQLGGRVAGIGGWLQRHAGLWLLLTGAAGAVLALQLGLDARYRLFPTAMLLVPALVYALRPAPLPAREGWLLLLLVASMLPLQVWEEGFGQIRNRVDLRVVDQLWLLVLAWSRNVQALGWMAVSLLLVVALWRGVRASRSAQATTANEAGVTA